MLVCDSGETAMADVAVKDDDDENECDDLVEDISLGYKSTDAFGDKCLYPLGTLR